MIEGWVTRDANSLLQPMRPAAFSRSLPRDALATIEIDDSRTFQPIEGFGFSLTGGSAYLLAGLATPQRVRLLEELFGEIRDEFDYEGPEITLVGSGEWLVSGAIEIDRLLKKIEALLPNGAKAS